MADLPPDFLIIGAMKAGTTTLYRWLKGHPQVFMPEEKEPNDLCDDAVLDEGGRKAYLRLFRSARPGQRIGEASTAYTKRPVQEGVAARARAVCSPSLRLIYMVRDPVARSYSHYRHELGNGRITASFEEALDSESDLIDFSRYAYQLEPWLEAFDPACLLVVRLEDLHQSPDLVSRRVLAHLGLPETGYSEPFVQANVGGQRRRFRGELSRRMVQSRMYQRRIKALIPRSLRVGIRNALLPPAHQVEAPGVTDAARRKVLGALTEGDRALAEGTWPPVLDSSGHATQPAS